MKIPSIEINLIETMLIIWFLMNGKISTLNLGLDYEFQVTMFMRMIKTDRAMAKPVKLVELKLFLWVMNHSI